MNVASQESQLFAPDLKSAPHASIQLPSSGAQGFSVAGTEPASKVNSMKHVLNRKLLSSLPGALSGCQRRLNIALEARACTKGKRICIGPMQVSVSAKLCPRKMPLLPAAGCVCVCVCVDRVEALRGFESCG